MRVVDRRGGCDPLLGFPLGRGRLGMASEVNAFSICKSQKMLCFRVKYTAHREVYTIFYLKKKLVSLSFGDEEQRK